MAADFNTRSPARRALLTAGVSLAALPALAGDRVSSTDAPGGDAALFALADELRQAEAAAERACEQHTVAERSGDEAAVTVAWDRWEAACDDLHAVVARMAETPATTLPGLLVKALRIAWQVRPETGHQMLAAEYDLAASVFADGLRLLPAADPRPASATRELAA